MAFVADVERPQALDTMSAQLQGEAPDAVGRKIDAMPAYIRRGFIRKVYSILSVQLMVNILVGAAMYRYIPLQDAESYAGAARLASLFSIGLILAVTCCCRGALKTFPSNFLILLAFTLAESFVVGFVCLMFTLPSVMLAMGTTCAVFFCLTLYAFYTKKDFTGFGPYLYVALCCMLCFLMSMFVWRCFAPLPPALETLYSFFGVLVFSFYIVYDTQLIIGGQHKKVSFEIDDYCLAALVLYLDILNLFLQILKLLGKRRN